MTDKLPPNLLALFAPRPALRYLPPSDRAPEERRTHHIDGLASFVNALHQKQEEDKDLPFTESWLQKRDREQLETQAKQKYLLGEGFEKEYKPNEDEGIRGDAFKTLFVSRLSYKVETKDLEREFSRFGPIERIRIVADKRGKPRGYAFILFERERDMKAAYKECEHLVLGNRRAVVDVERGRTVSGWRPRRFGGGLGGRNYTKVAALKPSGFGPPSGPNGFRGGGFRGGFDRGGGRGFRGGPPGGGGPRGYGGRSGGGYANGGPDGAPSGPRSGGGFGGSGGGFGRSGSDRFDDRGRGGNANFEPLPPRGGGYRDRDRDRESSYSSQKRPHEGGGYDEPRQRRRY